jgi:multidrug efflux pump subunit AcrA (membrane-fusion protein)
MIEAIIEQPNNQQLLSLSRSFLVRLQAELDDAKAELDDAKAELVRAEAALADTVKPRSSVSHRSSNHLHRSFFICFGRPPSWIDSLF